MHDCPPNCPRRHGLVDRLLGGLELRIRIDDLPEAGRLYGARALPAPSARAPRTRFGPRIRRRDRGLPASNRIHRGSLGVPRGAEAEARIRGPDSRLPFDANAKRSTPSPSASARDRKLGSDSSTGDQPVLRHRASSQRANPAKPERTSRGSELGPGQLKTLTSKGRSRPGTRSWQPPSREGSFVASDTPELGFGPCRPPRPALEKPTIVPTGGEANIAEISVFRGPGRRGLPPAASEARSGGPGGASPRPRRRAS
jgi:hypothetical protein